MFKHLPILLKKEILQILKDKSVFFLVFIMPLILVVIYGSAIRMDVKPVKLGIVCNNQTKVERTIVNNFIGSSYYKTILVQSFADGQKLLDKNQVKVLLYIPNTFSKDILNSNAQAMIYLNGSEAQLASLSDSYVKATLQQAITSLYPNATSNKITITSRNWFNEANESVWFLMSGQYVSIMTLMSVFLGCFVISREWDRGTIEPLAATNAKASEIVLAKLIVYYFFVIWSMFIVIGFSQFIYEIPIRGSIFFMVGSLAIYSLEMLCLGIFISAKVKNQFLSAQIAVVVGFLPTVMLSGMIFDLKAANDAIAFIGNILPPTYEVKAMRIAILSGGQESYLLFNAILQTVITIVLFALCVRQVQKDSK